MNLKAWQTWQKMVNDYRNQTGARLQSSHSKFVSQFSLIMKVKREWKVYQRYTQNHTLGENNKIN